MRRRLTSLLHSLPTLLSAALLCSCNNLIDPRVADNSQQLEQQLAPQLALLGARNWIVIADPTYPVLAGKGVVVQATEAGSIETLDAVLSLLDSQGNLTPRIWRCSELEAVPELRAPGVRQHRRELEQLLASRLHYDVTERIISLQLTQAAQTYRILYVKTATPLPYSTIAIELDSGYWNSDAESEIRSRLEHHNSPARLKPLPQHPRV